MAKFAILLLVLAAYCQHPAVALLRRESYVPSSTADHHTPTKKAYVVYLGGHSHGPHITSADLDRVTDSHHRLLASVLGSKESAAEAIIYSYRKNINGFAATLDDEDAQKISELPGVVSVFPSRGKKTHTTHTWNWLNLEDPRGKVPRASLWTRANFGNDVIIANIDTGVWPESESFSDEGFGPVPSRWKGSCENSTLVACNRKLIGAKYFNRAYLEFIHGNMSRDLNDARDREGHGSHTLSTAGGNFVENATVVRSVVGTAKGGSPKARVAAYKACWPEVGGSGGCFDADIMAAFDEAIHDGVDVISVSLGGSPGPYFQDGISIGAFHAMQRNIPVIASAGNDGPLPGTVTNVAPWLLTVAAATHDRRMESSVDLPNGLILRGLSLSPPLPGHKLYPAVRAGNARSRNASFGDADLCFSGSLDEEKVRGKIVACLRGVTGRVEKGKEAARAGAAGMILCNDQTTGDEIHADLHFLPASHITYGDGLSLYAYLNSTTRPAAYIQPPRPVFHVAPAPEIVDFSSRGPNTVTRQILKPDISAPGVDIVAAWSPLASPSDNASTDSRPTPYNVISGTSMSCPHVAGVVALLKSLHSDWSPAAIKSAIMTTGRLRDNTMHPIRDSVDNNQTTPFAYGAGHVRPNRAMDPGLVYDMTADDHFNFLCALGYNQTAIRLISGRPHRCPPQKFSLNDYNYPSISVTGLAPGKHVTVTRTLKNVGPAATYSARLRSPPGVILAVEPETLRFTKVGEEQSFKVSVKAEAVNEGHTHGFGQLLWSDGKHYVRSPIAATFVTTDSTNLA